MCGHIDQKKEEEEKEKIPRRKEEEEEENGLSYFLAGFTVLTDWLFIGYRVSHRAVGDMKLAQCVPTAAAAAACFD